MEAKAITSSFLPADSWHSHGIQHTWDYSVASVYSPKNHLPLTCFRQLWGTTAATSGTDWASLWPTWVPGSWAALRELPLSFLNFDSPALPSALEAPKPCIKPLPSWNTNVFSAIMIEPWVIIVTYQVKAYLKLFFPLFQ